MLVLWSIKCKGKFSGCLLKYLLCSTWINPTSLWSHNNKIMFESKRGYKKFVAENFICAPNGYLGSWRNSAEEKVALSEGYGCTTHDGSCKGCSFCNFAGKSLLDFLMQFDLCECWKYFTHSLAFGDRNIKQWFKHLNCYKTGSWWLYSISKAGTVVGFV